MSDDDPFALPESDRTIIIPSPGGRGQARAKSASSSPVHTSLFSDAPHEPAGAPMAVDSGLNPLLAAANPLLDVVPQLRTTLSHPDPIGLRDYLAQGIKTFEGRAKVAGITSDKVIAARYALCTLLDETVTSTPWGGSGVWSGQSLLVMFHNETGGGEKFFQLLAKLAENPNANRDVLELMYVCLSLGFEGRYRVLDNGKSQLETLRERLVQMLQKQRAEYERDLAPHWRGATVKRGRVFEALPLWVVAAVCGLLLVGIYLGFSYTLNNASDPVFAQIQAMRVNAPAKPAPQPAAAPRLATFLAPEIQAGLVAVRDESTRSIVTLRGDGLFAPGSTTVSPKFMALLTRIAEALNAVPGQVQVTGHTDNVPIRTARFPSNWHLSQERARSVMQLLAAQGVAGRRLSAEGRADAEAIVANDSAPNRARNRRVEITLSVARASG